jgi:hypothetical protein
MNVKINLKINKKVDDTSSDESESKNEPKTEQQDNIDIPTDKIKLINFQPTAKKTIERDPNRQCFFFNQFLNFK